jgi:hypothetical protein
MILFYNKKSCFKTNLNNVKNKQSKKILQALNKLKLEQNNPSKSFLDIMTNLKKFKLFKNNSKRNIKNKELNCKRRFTNK